MLANRSEMGGDLKDTAQTSLLLCFAHLAHSGTLSFSHGEKLCLISAKSLLTFISVFKHNRGLSLTVTKSFEIPKYNHERLNDVLVREDILGKQMICCQ